MLLRIARAKSRCKKENRPLKPKDLFRLKGFMVAGTDNRCYKEAVSLERGICILQEEAGRQFDPKLVPIFVAELKRRGIHLAGQRPGADQCSHSSMAFSLHAAAAEKKPLLFFANAAIFFSKRITTSKRRARLMGYNKQGTPSKEEQPWTT